MVKIGKDHPCVITTLATLAYIAAFILVGLLKGGAIDFIEVTLSAAIFGVVFFIGWTYIGKHIEKRRKKK